MLGGSDSWRLAAFLAGSVSSTSPTVRVSIRRPVCRYKAVDMRIQQLQSAGSGDAAAGKTCGREDGACACRNAVPVVSIYKSQTNQGGFQSATLATRQHRKPGDLFCSTLARHKDESLLMSDL